MMSFTAMGSHFEFFSSHNWRYSIMRYFVLKCLLLNQLRWPQDPDKWVDTKLPL